MLIITTLGLLINLFGLFILYPTWEYSLNLRSAFINLAADSLGSMATMAAGFAILLKGLYWFYPVAGRVIGVMIIIGNRSPRR